MSSTQPSAPLTADEQARLDHLIRRGARHLAADERNRLLQLWERRRVEDSQARHAIGGLTGRIRRLTRTVADYEAVIRSQRAELLAADATP